MPLLNGLPGGGGGVKLPPQVEEEWRFTGHTGSVVAVAVDTSGNVYSGGGDKTVRKINSSGAQIWNFTNNTSSVSSITVDISNNVYSSGYGLQKLNSSGSRIWSFTGHTNDINGVAVDTSGNIYSASSDKTVRKINSSGTQVWSFTGHTNKVNSVAVDNSGNVYSGSLDKTVRKLNSSGSQIWSFTGHTDNVNTVAVDNFGNVYSGSGGIFDQTVRKISSIGTQVWTFTEHGDYVRGIAVDISGNAYIASDDQTVRKITPTGTQIWSFAGHTGWVRTVAVDTSGNIYSGSSDKTVRKLKQTEGVLYLTDPAKRKQPMNVSQMGSIKNTLSCAWSMNFDSTPLEIVSDQYGSVYISTNNHSIHKISMSGKTLWSIDNAGDHIAIYDDRLYYSYGNNASINSVSTDNPSNIAVLFTDNILPTNAEQNGQEYCYSALALKTDHKGNLFFVNTGGYIFKINRNGDILWTLSLGTAIDFSKFYSIEIDSSGGVYLLFNGHLYKYNADGTASWDVETRTSDITYPVNVVKCDRNNNIYYHDSYGREMGGFVKASPDNEWIWSFRLGWYHFDGTIYGRYSNLFGFDADECCNLICAVSKVVESTEGGGTNFNEYTYLVIVDSSGKEVCSMTNEIDRSLPCSICTGIYGTVYMINGKLAKYARPIEVYF